MVLPDSHQIPRVQRYLGGILRDSCLSCTGLSPSVVWLSSQLPLNSYFVTPRPICSLAPDTPATPPVQRLQPITHQRFGLLPFRSPLLRESLLLSFPPATKMFQFTGSGSADPILFRSGYLVSYQVGSPIRKSTDLSSLAAPRGLSQLATSFLAS